MKNLLTTCLIVGVVLSAPIVHTATPDDTVLDLAIENTLLRSEALDGHDLNVEVVDGIATFAIEVGTRHPHNLIRI